MDDLTFNDFLLGIKGIVIEERLSASNEQSKAVMLVGKLETHLTVVTDGEREDMIFPTNPKKLTVIVQDLIKKGTDVQVYQNKVS